MWYGKNAQCQPVLLMVHGKVRAYDQRAQQVSYDFLMNAGRNIISKKHWQSEEIFSAVAIITVQGGPALGDYTDIIQSWSF